MNAKNVKVTTTSGFDGVEIEEYLEPVAAHVVVGMNLFKDLIAGFSDLFGGKSSTYQNTLATINDEVINELRKKTHALGGNCILGLKIDNDEVAAQGKSMIMVTAIGTAARANFNSQNLASFNKSRTNSISIEKYNFLKQKKHYINAGEKGTLLINEEFWDFVKTNRVAELAPYLLEKLLHLVESSKGYTSESLTYLTGNIKDYFSIIDTESAIACLYDRLLKEPPFALRSAIVDIVKDLYLVDFKRIIGFLESQDFNVQKTGIHLLVAQKMSYDRADIQYIEDIIELIFATFKERGERTTKKKVLTGKHKDIWICECGRENDMDKAYCSNCYKDIYGFFEEEIKHPVVIIKLKDELEILKEEIG
jgi:uncharacterized protein YbjQ (UPF0145 family)